MAHFPLFTYLERPKDEIKEQTDDILDIIDMEEDDDEANILDIIGMEEDDDEANILDIIDMEEDDDEATQQVCPESGSSMVSQILPHSSSQVTSTHLTSPLHGISCQPWIRVYPPEEPMKGSGSDNIENVGPRNIPEETNTPLDFFLLFFTPAIWLMMVQATNQFARASGSCSSNWTDITVEEMKQFWALLINMAFVRNQNFRTYWYCDPNQYMPFYNKIMRFKRFKDIMTNFNISNKMSPPIGQPGYDPWVKIMDFVTILNDRFKCFFAPGRSIYIDESVIVIKNKNAFIQYTPYKHFARYGIKKFDLCDLKTGYILHTDMHSGKDFLAGGPEPFIEKVVQQLLAKTDLLDKSHHLFIDNFYPKVPLAKWLYEHKTCLSSLIRPGSKEFSTRLLEAKWRANKILYFRKKEILFVKYGDCQRRKTVCFITTACNANDDVHIVQFGNKIQRKGWVANRIDQLCYTVTKRTQRYWKKVVYNFVDMAILNAFCIYKALNPCKKVSRYKFMRSIVDELVQKPLALCNSVVSRGEHVWVRLPFKRGRLCEACGKKTGSRKHRRSYLWCRGCNIGIHQVCHELVHFPCAPTCGVLSHQ